MQVELQYAEEIEDHPVSEQDCARWVRLTTETLQQPQGELGDVCVRICGEVESRSLNATYREKDVPTNVLSFPGANEVAGEILGDLALCLPVVQREALDQGKSVRDHTAHLVVHGVLHLMGFDHETDTEAAEMEHLEIRILDVLGISNPYL
jgi:probable rRNA maturation factor